MSITSEHSGMESILKNPEVFRAAVDMAVIISITDITGKIIYVNSRFVEVSQYSAAELIGHKHNIVNSGYHPASFFADMWGSITRGNYWRGEIRNRAKDGSFYWVDTVITPVLDREGNIRQFLSVRNLITKQKEHEENLLLVQRELLKRERQLNDAQQVAKTGSWYLEWPANRLSWSAETYRIFDIANAEPMTYAAFLELVHPQDRAYVESMWQLALKGAPYELEHRIVTRSGIKWVSERAQLEFDANGKLAGAVGTVQDISIRKETERSREESVELYKGLFDKSPFPLGILEKDTMRFLEVNQTATLLYGYTREEFLTLTAYDIRDPDDHDKMRQQLRSGSYTWDSNSRLHRTKNGALIRVEPSITEVNYKGKPAFLITINDVTEKLRLQEEILRANTERQQEINRAGIEAQEKSRADIGRELHDNINQLLAASSLYLKNAHPLGPKDADLLNTARTILADAILEIKKLSWSIVPPDLKHQDLVSSLQDLLMSFKMSDLKIASHFTLYEEQLSEGLKLNIYRIVQEQLNNILKHAQATEVHLSLQQNAEFLKLEIEDNGKGFYPEKTASGLGLHNIRHRAETYNGRVDLSSSPGNGCRLCISFTL